MKQSRAIIVLETFRAARREIDRLRDKRGKPPNITLLVRWKDDAILRYDDDPDQAKAMMLRLLAGRLDGLTKPPTSPVKKRKPKQPRGPTL